MKSYEKIIQETVLNKETGELQTKDFKEVTTYGPSKKQGWCAMYKTMYDELMMNLNSRLEKKVFMQVRDSFTAKKQEVHFNKTRVAEDFSSTRPTISRIFKKLEDLEAIKHLEDGVYRLNPYMYIPYQADGLELQREWENLLKD